LLASSMSHGKPTEKHSTPNLRLFHGVDNFSHEGVLQNLCAIPESAPG
jgi:hypothetical protein